MLYTQNCWFCPKEEALQKKQRLSLFFSLTLSYLLSIQSTQNLSETRNLCKIMFLYVHLLEN